MLRLVLRRSHSSYHKSIELRVGLVKTCAAPVDLPSHLIVSQVQISDAKEATMQIVSGLREFYSAELMVNRKVLVLCNLKPSKFRGVKSDGMLLCASKQFDDKTVSVEVLRPSDTAKVGKLVVLRAHDDQYSSEDVDLCTDHDQKYLTIQSLKKTTNLFTQAMLRTLIDSNGHVWHDGKWRWETVDGKPVTVDPVMASGTIS